MWLIRTALRRPITIVVAVIAVALTAVFAVSRMRVDIFPDLNLPVIYVAQPYGGMSPAQMEGYVTYYYEYHFLYINGIESVESKSIQNTSLLKLTFHAGTDMAEALAQTIGYVEPRARVHAARHRRSVHHAVRRGHRAGRLSHVFEPQPQPRRDSGSRAQPRPPAVRDARRPDVAAAVRRQPADDRRARRSRSAARVRHGAGRSDPRRQRRQRHHAVRQRERRRPDAHLAGELRRDERQRTARVADPRRSRADGVPARRRIGDRQHGHSDGVRARQRTPRRLHSGDEAARRVDAHGRQRGEGQPRRDSRRSCRTTSPCRTSSTSRTTSRARCSRCCAKRSSARCSPA